MTDFDAAVKLLTEECKGIQRDEPELGMEVVVRHVLWAALQDVTLAPMIADRAVQAARYEPPHLRNLVDSLTYKPGWTFDLAVDTDDDGSGGLALHIVSYTEDSFTFDQHIRVRHAFLVPAASWNRDVWAAWLFDRVRDVETHEAGEFFRLDGVREFAPHHSNGEDPYRVWHVSDWATAAKSSGDA